jgi:hypothetical protein
MKDKHEPLLESPALCGVFFQSPKSTDSSSTSFDATASSFDWPNLYEESYEMNLVSIIFYGLIDLRNLARKDQLTASDPTDIEALLQLPITADRIVRMVARNRERIIQFIGEENTEAYVKAFDAIVGDESLELEFDPETGKSALVSFDVVKVDDIHQDEELVYGVCVDSARKRITVVFRGCSTRRDWTLSADHYLSEYVYQGSTVAMHRGFSQYLFGPNPSSNKTPYEAIFETVKALLKLHPTYHVYVTGKLGVDCVYQCAGLPYNSKSTRWFLRQVTVWEQLWPPSLHIGWPGRKKWVLLLLASTLPPQWSGTIPSRCPSNTCNGEVGSGACALPTTLTSSPSFQIERATCI